MRRARKPLPLLVLTPALSISASVGAYSGTSGRWAKSAIDRRSAYGVVPLPYAVLMFLPES